MSRRGLRSLALTSLFAGALLTSTLPARDLAAQPAVAAKAMVEGDKAAAAKKWDEALAAYEKAHKAQPSGATATRLANALYQLNRPIEALDAYEKALKDYSATLLGKDKKLAADRVTELQGKIGSITITVNEAGAAVSLDGKSVGSSPLAAPLRVPAGSHKISVSKDGLPPFETTVEVAGKATVPVNVELKAPPPPETPKVEAKKGSLEIRTEHPKAKIAVDGGTPTEGNFKGELEDGEHEYTITLDGYQTVTKKITVAAGEVIVETVTLRKATAGSVAEKFDVPWSFNGVYGGFQLVGMFEPTGSGNTLQSSCPVTGATSCEASGPMGGAIAGYVGYAFDPIGLEVFLLGGGDITEPSASFDGVTGSEVNPLVAAPAREEAFTIGRFGGGGAARLRLLFPVDRFRFTGAVGAGVAYRHMLLARETVAENGATSSTGNDDGTGYVTGVLSVELAAQVLMAGTSSFVVGFNLWLEHAGDGVATPAESDVFLTKDGEIPAPQATPAYDMASGTQLFLGPFLGFHFGP